MVALALDVFAVAVSPPCFPAGAGPALSVASEVIRPPPVPNEVLRTVWPVGAIQAVVADVLSAQYDTTQAEAGSSSTGVTCDPVNAVSAAPAYADTTGPVGAVPRYAESRKSDWTVAESPTVTLDGSLVPATRCHSAVVIPLADWTVWTRVHPAGSDIGVQPQGNVQKSTIPSTDMTPDARPT
jgi:hypothetical protein